MYQGCECVVHAIFTICVLFLVCYSILNASCEKSFAQLRYDLIDHIAVSLALQLWHNSLHDLSFVSRSDQVCMFLCKVSLDIPVLIAAKNALDVLKTSAYVEVDCESGVVSAN